MQLPPYALTIPAAGARLLVERMAHDHHEMIRHARVHFRAEQAARDAFTEKYGHGRAPMATKMNGKWVVAIGGAIYKQEQEGHYDLINVIHDHALMVFGIPLQQKDEAKPAHEQHVALGWMRAMVDANAQLREQGDDGRKALQTGDGAAWGRLAYDLFTIADNSDLQKAMIRRIASGVDFQGARHELRVAALCVVAGFQLHYEDEKDGTRTHPEFTGKDRFSEVSIAVEAKSRHRHGVQGFVGGHAVDPGERVNVRGLVLEAFKKLTDLPLYVFVDANLPPCDDTTYRRWMGEIDQTMADLEAEGRLEGCPANCVIFTNDPSHYLGQAAIGGPEDRLWIRPFKMSRPRTPHPAGADLVPRFLKAHAQRLAPPTSILADRVGE